MQWKQAEDFIDINGLMSHNLQLSVVEISDF